MRLFDDFEIVRFPEENLFFVTQNKYLYYLYSHQNKRWEKYRNAGNDKITVSNYQEVSRDEVVEVMNGVFPQKETDLLRLFSPWQLCTRDLIDLLSEDYPAYMSDDEISFSVLRFLQNSDIRDKSYLGIKEILDQAKTAASNTEQVLADVKALSFAHIGRDIFKKEIGIVDGRDSSSYFWILPVRTVDHKDTDETDPIVGMDGVGISIEEDDVDQYLTPFLYKYFDNELEANKKRVDDCWIDEEGVEQRSYISGFEWHLEPNYYTSATMEKILKDIKETCNALSSGIENEYTAKLREKRGFATFELVYAKNLSKEEIKQYNDARPIEDDTEVELIIDFYQRFIYRMEYMIRVGKEKGFDLICFTGP